jgi:large subunit ribosomal protein L10
MSVNRTLKEDKVASYTEAMEGAGLVVVLRQNSLNADQTLALRRAGHEQGVAILVAKNSLVKIALKEAGLEGLDPYMQGQTMLAFSEDAVTAAKVAANFAKENKDGLILMAAAMNGQILDQQGAMALATLPSLDELRGKLIGLLQAPATKVAGVLQAPAGQLARVMAAKAKAA